MKQRLIALLATVLGTGALHAGFLPVPLNPSSFNADVVVEKEALPALNQRSTASVDGGTNNSGNTWYEVGYNAASPASGLPTAGSTFTHLTFPDRSYVMAPSFTANNAILIDSAVTNAIFSLTTPAAFGALSIIASSGNGGGNIIAVVLHQDGSKETNVFNPGDWFNRANQAWTANGRLNAQTYGLADVDTGNPRLNSSEFALANTGSPVTSISFTYSTGNANVHNAIWAISGGSTTNGAFSPIVVTGFNQDMVVEVGSPAQGPVLDTLGAPATTQTLDSDLNTGNTWYERGYNLNNPTSSGTNAAFSGLPAPGATVTDTNGTYSFVMPPTYVGNNAVFLNQTVLAATITPATPTAATVLSFLGASGGGQANLGFVVHYQDGSMQTGILPILDWFSGGTPMFQAKGRVASNTGVFDSVNSANPRLFHSDLVLANTTSPVTSIDLAYTQAGPRPSIFAMSASAGVELPFFIVQPAGVRNYSGSAASFGAVASSTGSLAYKWQKGTNGVFVDVSNGGTVSGATTTNLVNTAFGLSDDADYRCVASNSAGSANSSTVHLTVVSELSDITTPGDPISVPAGYGTDNPPNESVSHAIDNLTGKWLGRDADGAAPFVGPVGMVVTPSLGRTIVSGIRLYTANDTEDRDPRDYKLEGSNNGGATYAVISSGNLALPGGRNAGGLSLDPVNQNLQQLLFANTVGYSTYRLSFQNMKNNANVGLFQIAEIELLGVVDTSVGLPAVSVSFTMANAVIGQPVTMTGTAFGNPTPTYQWIKKGVAGDTVLVNGGNISGATSGSLMIAATTANDGGLYALVGINSQGSVTSAPITLTLFSGKMDIITTVGATATSFGGVDDQDASFAIDHLFSSWQNRGHGPNAGAGFAPFGGPVGLEITPAQSTIVTGLRLYASDSNPQDDPLDYKLEGSNDGGATYRALSSGLVDLPLARNNLANAVAPSNPDGTPNSVREFLFGNGQSFTSYRLTFSDIRVGGDTGSSGTRLWLGEVELLGVAGTASPITVSVMKQTGGTLELQWTSGSLLESTNVTGPWTTNTTAVSPFTVTPTEPQKFYQILGQ
jgi:hypothetical protein